MKSPTPILDPACLVCTLAIPRPSLLIAHGKLAIEILNLKPSRYIPSPNEAAEESKIAVESVATTPAAGSASPTRRRRSLGLDKTA
jgi:hypothetical protein